MNKIKRVFIIVLTFIMFSGLFVVAGCNQENVDFSELNYLAIGDSITRSQRFAPVPYSETVKSILGLNDAQNVAVSGSTLIDGASNRDCIYNQIALGKDADIISLLGGVNDYSANAKLGTIDSEDETEIFGALNRIVSRLKEKYNGKFIFIMTPLKCISKTGKNSAGVELLDIVNAIKSVGNKYSIKVLDLYNECEFSNETDPDNSDGLHPSQKFVTEKLSPVVGKFIKENYR